jgi:hypothetical protein
MMQRPRIHFVDDTRSNIILFKRLLAKIQFSLKDQQAPSAPCSAIFTYSFSEYELQTQLEDKEVISIASPVDLCLMDYELGTHQDFGTAVAARLKMQKYTGLIVLYSTFKGITDDEFRDKYIGPSASVDDIHDKNLNLEDVVKLLVRYLPKWTVSLVPQKNSTLTQKKHLPRKLVRSKISDSNKNEDKLTPIVIPKIGFEIDPSPSPTSFNSNSTSTPLSTRLISSTRLTSSSLTSLNSSALFSSPSTGGQTALSQDFCNDFRRGVSFESREGSSSFNNLFSPLREISPILESKKEDSSLSPGPAKVESPK